MKTCFIVFPFEYYPLSFQKTQKNDYSSFLLPTLERDTWLFSWFIFFIDGDTISPKALKPAFHLKFSEICHTLSIEVQSKGFIQDSEAKVSFWQDQCFSIMRRYCRVNDKEIRPITCTSGMILLGQHLGTTIVMTAILPAEQVLQHLI